MRYKIVPPARDRTFLRSVADALPRVPNSVEDCCSRIRDRTDVPSRDVAREYLTFCQALGLAAETDGAYYRDPDPPTDAELPAAFLASVFAAREVLEALNEADAPARPDEVYAAAVEPLVPDWERNRNHDWAATWRDRTERLCEWAVTFGLAERTDGGFRAVADPDDPSPGDRLPGDDGSGE